jgi:Fur family transcriptional regulator, iron response regulator
MNIVHFLEQVETRRTGCPLRDVRGLLKKANLRPTRQRIALGWMLFAKGDRHLTAESLYDEAQKAKLPVSLATIYNTLHQFTTAGLIREVAADGARAIFDTNMREHHHYLIEGEDTVLDIPPLKLGEMPIPPQGYEISRVEVVVRLRKIAA